jgi:hypothetical protein
LAIVKGDCAPWSWFINSGRKEGRTRGITQKESNTQMGNENVVVHVDGVRLYL